MEEWTKCNIGDVCKTISDTYRGDADKVVLVNTSDVLEGKCLNHQKSSNKDLKGQFKKTFQQDDILYSEIRPANKRFAYIDFDGTDYIASTKLMVIRHYENIIPQFLYYFITSHSVIEELQMLAESRSGTFPQITFSELASLPIMLPPLSEQTRIVAILKSLDDKIELNRRINDNFFCQKLLEIILIWMITSLINDNLEQQAQALFKSWFVDFKPFKDGEFMDTELGRIPKKWKVGNYDEIIKETISGDWGKEKPQGNFIHKVACIRGCDFQDIKNGLRGKTPERYILEKNYQNKHFLDKDILVEISGGTATVSTGRVCPVSQQLIDKFDSNIVCTNFCRIIRPKSGFGAYLYYSWLYKYNNKIMFGYENGTSGIKNFRIKDFTSLEPILIPPQDVVIRFQCFIDTILILMQSRGTESQRLSQIRDALLPRLMSGELRVIK